MKTTKKQLEKIKEIEKKVASVCDNTDEIFDEITGKIFDEITGIVYPKESNEKVQEKNITLKEFVALCVADIDTFLLLDESQENDNDKLYTKEEIRHQLKLTMYKMTNLPFVCSSVFDIDLFSALGHQVLLNSGFSEKYIKSLKKK